MKYSDNALIIFMVYKVSKIITNAHHKFPEHQVLPQEKMDTPIGKYNPVWPLARPFWQDCFMFCFFCTLARFSCWSLFTLMLTFPFAHGIVVNSMSKYLPVFSKVVYRKQRQCCVTCGEQGSVSLPCGHGLQCDSCSTSTECPLCPEQTLEQQLSWPYHQLGPPQIPDQSVLIAQKPALDLNRHSKLCRGHFIMW